MFRGPCRPAGARARDIFQADAVDRANRHAQLAARAVRLDDAVHQLVAAHDGVDRTRLDAKCATDAPGFVDDGHRTRGFDAMSRIQRLNRQAGDP